MKIQFVNHNFYSSTLKHLEVIDGILSEYSSTGYSVTLRHLFYTMVSRGIIENSHREYVNLGKLLQKARLAGLIDMEESDSLQGAVHYESPRDALLKAAKKYRVDVWAGQKYRPEIWFEKYTITEPVKRVAEEMGVGYFCCNGYPSQAEMWGAATRMIECIEQDQIPVIIHLSDHDATGLHMTEDIKNRTNLFLGKYGCDGTQEVIRAALTMDQVSSYRLPPNPSKEKDFRFKDYAEVAGTSETWELDALHPKAIEKIVKDQLSSLVNAKLFRQMVTKEKEDRKMMEDLIREGFRAKGE